MDTLKTSQKTPFFPENIKIDDNLGRCATNEEVETVLKQKLRVFDSIEEKLNCDAPAFPSDYALIKLSILAYKSVNCQTGLPAGWEFLTAAWNTDRTNGYFGAAYFNEEHQQIVIAHRGTSLKCWGAVRTDIDGVVCTRFVPQLNSAITFADEMLSTINKLNYERKFHLKLTFTGHSLGGWLAQITAFSTKYLTRVLEAKHFRINDDVSDGYHAHVVAFDSPGCKDMLDKLKDEYCLRLKPSDVDLDSLDISTYLSAPNRINTFNSHLGTVYRVFINMPGWDDDRYFVTNVLLAVKRYFVYTRDTHSKDSIAECFDSHTGRVKQCSEVVDWPISKGKIIPDKEYRDLFQNANFENRVETNKEIRVREDVLRYTVCPHDETVVKFRVFSWKELSFLVGLKYFGLLSEIATNIFRITSDDDKIAFQIIESRLKSFEIDDRLKTVKFLDSGHFHEYVSFIKRVIHFCPDIFVPLKGPYSCVTNVVLKMFKTASERYLTPFKNNSLDFNVTSIFLDKILESEEAQIFIEFENETFAGILKLYKIFNSVKDQTKYNADNFLFLNMKQILDFQPYLSFLKFIREINDEFLLVIECNLSDGSESADKTRVNLNELKSILKEKKKLKMILVVQHENLTWYSDIFEQYESITSSGIHFRDLTSSSRKLILNEERVLFQGYSISLAKMNPTLKYLFDIKELIKFFPLQNFVQCEIAFEAIRDSQHDVFALANITLEQLQNKIGNKNQVLYSDLDYDKLIRIVVLDNDDSEKQFYNICWHLSQRARIHLLIYNDNQLILKDSCSNFNGEHDHFIKRICSVSCNINEYKYFHIEELIPGIFWCSKSQIFLEDKRIVNEMLEKVFSTNTLLKLGNKETLNAGSEIVCLDEVEQFHISRTISAEMEVKFLKDIEDENGIIAITTDNYFLISCFSFRYHVLFYKYITFSPCKPMTVVVLNMEEATSQFKKLCVLNQSRRVYWLTQEQYFSIERMKVENEMEMRLLINPAASDILPYFYNDTFIVIDSNCKNSNAICQKVDFDEYYNVDKQLWLECIREQVVTVDGGPGMGKSELFANITVEKKRLDPSIWVLKLDLLNLSSQFKETLNSVPYFQTKQQVFEFLITSLQLQSEFEIGLFECYLNMSKVIFIFDGFDEICPLYCDIFTKLIDMLTKEMKPRQIWLSSRPNALVETKFGSRCYKLEGLSVKEQTEFLNLYANSSFELSNVPHNFEHVLTRLNSSSGGNYFTSVPLFLKLVADYFEIKNTFAEQDYLDKFSHFDFSSLYGTLINESIMRCIKKTGLDIANQIAVDYAKTAVRTTFKDLTTVAAFYIFNENFVKDNLVSKFEVEEMETIVKSFETSQTKSGIITKFVNGVPNFVHKTFPDYLAAVWIVERIKRNNETDVMKLFEVLYKNMLINGDKIPYDVVNKQLFPYQPDDTLISNLRKCNIDKYKLLFLSVKNGCVALLKVFAQDEDILNAECTDLPLPEKVTDSTMLSCNKMIHFAVAYQKLDAVMYILQSYKREVDLFYEEMVNRSLLYFAVHWGNEKIVRTLLDLFSGVFSNAIDDTLHFDSVDLDTQTPLKEAIRNNHVDVVRVLLSYGDITFESLLNACIFISKPEITVFIIDYVLEHFKSHLEKLLTFKFMFGDSLLIVAVRGNFEENIVERLISLGTKLKIENYEDHSALSVAVEYSHDRIITLFLRKNPTIDVVVNSAHYIKNTNALRLIIEFIKSKYGEINILKLVKSKNKTGGTILHSIVAIPSDYDFRLNFDQSIFEYLISMGADLRSRDDLGMTVLSAAAKANNIFMIRNILGMMLLTIDDIVDTVTSEQFPINHKTSPDVAETFSNFVALNFPEHCDKLEGAGIPCSIQSSNSLEVDRNSPHDSANDL